MTRIALAVLAVTALASAAPGPGQPQTDDVVQKARKYVDEWQTELSGLVASEEYTQHLHVRFGGSQTIRLKSDVLLVRVQRRWIGFRDIGEVDGRPIEGRGKRLEELFIRHPLAEAMAQARRISDEGARYNLGSVYRNFNVPATALQILEPEREGHVEFKLERPESVAGQPAAVLSFRERQPPTIIVDKAERQYVFTHGQLWLDQATGRILATELRWRLAGSRGAIHMDASVNVSYHADPKTGISVPQKMIEKYETEKELIDCDAVYSDIRQFRVTAQDDVTLPR